MPDIILDGSGNGYRAKVDSNYRLFTNAVTIDEDQEATKTGKSFNINTGIITLTDANETPLFYFKNNENSNYHITAIIIGSWTSTGGTGIEPQITIVKNPTGGTIISNANDVSINSNRNFGSSEILDALAYKGATGETLTGGLDHLIFVMSTSGRLVALVDEVIPKGLSLGIKYTPQTSNTSQKIYAAIVGHLEGGF